MGFVGLEEALKMVRRGQVPGEGTRCEAQVEDVLSFMVSAIAGSKHLSVLHGRIARPKRASRGRSCYRFEAPVGGLLSLGFKQYQIILGKRRGLQSEWKHSGFPLRGTEQRVRRNNHVRWEPHKSPAPWPGAV